MGRYILNFSSDLYLLHFSWQCDIWSGALKL